jgi:hypothetical protein
MYLCILFIMSTGAGFVTDSCVSHNGTIVQPQQVRFLFDQIPTGYAVYSVPRQYVSVWNNPEYQGTEYSYNVEPQPLSRKVVRVYRPLKQVAIDTSKWIIRTSRPYRKYSRSKRAHRQAHSRVFRSSDSRRVRIQKRPRHRKRRN